MMKYAKLIFSLAICCTAILGDYTVFKSRMSQSFTFRAISDSVVHASIGFFSSLLFFCGITISSQAKVYNILFCTFISSFIDIDHALVARSFVLKDYAHLSQRGVFHCTTFWIIISGATLAYSILMRKLNIYVLAWMLVIAFTSHHIRDGNRRGLWMFPFGHTRPIPKYMYIALISLLPIAFSYTYAYFRPPDKQTILHTFVR